MRDTDQSQLLQQRVLSTIADKTPLQIIGGNSKTFYGRAVQATPLLTTEHCGIIDYQPSELVLTARCGTPLTEIENLLAEHGQMLAFEPPHFGETATLGGTIATGLSGSRRAYSGAVRDVVLGIRRGELLKFGGQVMKNVAGFDVSRLQVGALGTLGLLLDVSVKVLPRPETEITLCFEMNQAQALSTMCQWGRQNLPISGLSFVEHKLYLRLAGSEKALQQVQKSLGGELLMTEQADYFWTQLREQQHPFFQTDMPLWRVSLEPATPALDENCFIDWGGALRWLKTERLSDVTLKILQQQNAHIDKFRSSTGSEFQELPPQLMRLHQKIKLAFDPHNIFNYGRLYAEF
ncbi:MAG: glycolate oxidase subunit GlcE [Methylococcaceae bacterium]